VEDRTDALREVISLGFEARCVGIDGARSIWHGGEGLRVDARRGTTTMIADPANLPAGPCFRPALGRQELGGRDGLHHQSPPLP